MTVLTLIASVIIAFSTVFLIYAFAQTTIEREKRAAVRLGFLTFFWILFFTTIWFLPGEEIVRFLISGIGMLITAFILILVVPWPSKQWDWSRGRPDRIDERNIMFSRAELVPGTERFNSYYKEFPEHKQPDDNFRKLPGLLSKNSSFYNPWAFAAADASFYTVESLRSRTEGKENVIKIINDPQDNNRFIAHWARDMGCHSIGFTHLYPHHLYTIGGRKHNYGEPVINKHKFAIAFTVEMDFQRVRSAPRGPIIMESSAQYLRAGTIAVQLASFIRNLGFPAEAHIDGKYQVRCTEVAKDAGLGELGRMSLLMTPDLGPRVRIGVVTTDIPLEISPTSPDTSMLKFCRRCMKCAEACPVQAIDHSDPKEVGGTKQWVINQEACFTYWCKSGTDCGRCISVCPYSHPDNFLHKMVRFLIRRSPLFILIAIRMDNWLYGKKPPEKKLPIWMEH